MLFRPGVCWLDDSDSINVGFPRGKRRRGLIKKTRVLDVEEKELFKKIYIKLKLHGKRNFFTAQYSLAHLTLDMFF